jgi:hypothetical protein
MENPIKSIWQWQVDAGNAKREYDDFLESSFQIEEALEGFDLSTLPNQTGGECPKTISRQICKPLAFNGTDVDRLDKACDAVVYAIGSMAKLGLNAQEIQQALLIVNQANKAKLGCPRDEEGKLLKPSDFDERYAPEPKLQKILDQRQK